ncbi:hypothetical protein ACFV0H_11985 [Streptomyces erythrochromogenes]|uniref:Uncharacterized protein n=1 Tax=Streptomyces erythrochromogenes TaxID=285574 RepID=A0ABZ1Q484_9ACTN|nr:hypothetical protein [Streptomyces erythrochromogenes]MCX5583896.1 hypothetical protein [Streptomyces erythrochromogenes]
MRKIITGALVAALTVLATGTAVADDNRESRDAPVVALINIGQIDDPMEDVLEHTLNFGDGYKRD